MDCNLKYLFFDLDDTLCNYSGAKERARCRINKELERNRIDCDVFWTRYRQTEPKLMQEFLQNKISRAVYRKRRFYNVLEVLCGNAEELSQIVNEIFMTEGNRVDLFDDVLPFLDFIVSKKINAALLTNGPSDGQRRKIGAVFLEKYFRKIYISEEVGFSKPDKHFFLHVLRDLNLKPNQALMIGDSMKDDYMGSESSGIPCVLIDRFGINNDFNGSRVESLLELKEILKEGSLNSNLNK